VPKRPHRTAQPRGSKEPRTGVPDWNRDVQAFRWRTHDVDLDGPFGWEHVPISTLLTDVIPKLQDREQATWQDLRNGGSHPVSTSQFSVSAQRRLQERYEEFVGDSLFSLRLTGTCRIWGQRNGNVLEIFWYDPHHEVCPGADD
jgi:hypothetical protein